VSDPLGQVFREAGTRIVAALAARYRDLDLAEDAFADACMRAAETWPRDGAPRDAAAWLYRAADRRALDAIRHRHVRDRLLPDTPEMPPSAEDMLVDDSRLIPDERLRLIFVCCHPALAVDSRAALALRLVCSLSVAEIARAFLTTEAGISQRLVRAKRKIAQAGVPFEVPGPEAWTERLDAVLATIEVAYSKAHEDAAGAGVHSGFAAETLSLVRVLAEMLPEETDVLAVAALVHYAEARRPARIDADGAMIPLSEQDPARWRRSLIAAADDFVARAGGAGAVGPRLLQALLHRAWCRRRSLSEPPPWGEVLSLYDALLVQRDDPFVRLNRAVALAETGNAADALGEISVLDSERLAGSLPYHAVRADLLRRLDRIAEARASYDAALALEPPPAERLWLTRRRDSLES
jgi:RNA polymerase sigma-70 factor (ECF subfamily)